MTGVAGVAELSTNPGLIGAESDDFADGRKSLAAEFMFNGNKIIVVANHLKSKLGDDPVLGVNQPPEQHTATQRLAQATKIQGFVADVLREQPAAKVIVLVTSRLSKRWPATTWTSCSTSFR